MVLSSLHGVDAVVPGSGSGVTSWEITTTAPRLSRTPVRIGRPTPRPGSDAHEILDEFGRADRLESLVDRGAVLLEGVGAQ